VLCRDENDKEACERLKALMHDCKVSDAGPAAEYDYVGERDFGDEDEAMARMDELTRLAGDDALDMSVRIKHMGDARGPPAVNRGRLSCRHRPQGHTAGDGGRVWRRTRH